MSILTLENIELARRIEAHGLKAWPAPGEMDLDGWRVKISGGFSQRLDSVTPVTRGQDSAEHKIHWCERYYNDRHMPCVVRLTDLYDDETLQPLLIARGYKVHGLTHVMIADVTGATDQPSPDVSLSDQASDDWFGAAMMVDKRAVIHADALIFTMTHLPWPHVFAEAGNGEGTVAIGCAQASGDLMGIFSMRTLPQQRRKGHARRVLGGLLTWGKKQAVKTAWLQVEASNKAAVALYASMGFRTLYDYRYLVRHPERD
jgi:GNAT superfamily N-acetyltransferase